MTVRIDLLKPSERRYQGPVSGRFIAFITILFVLASILLIVSYMIFTGLIQKQQLAQSKESWSVMEPRYKNLLAIQETTEHITALQEELKTWRKSGIDWHIVLERMRKLVPENIQITRMSIEDELEELDDELEAGKRSQAHRRFLMRIRGVSHGRNSESEVIDFISNLRSVEYTNTVFQSVTLNSMQKEQATENAKSFEISCKGKKRNLQ